MSSMACTLSAASLKLSVGMECQATRRQNSSSSNQRLKPLAADHSAVFNEIREFARKSHLARLVCRSVSKSLGLAPILHKRESDRVKIHRVTESHDPIS
jgi:hypothetical protein